MGDHIGGKEALLPHDAVHDLFGEPAPREGLQSKDELLALGHLLSRLLGAYIGLHLDDNRLHLKMVRELRVRRR